jgi:hypothetical protein
MIRRTLALFAVALALPGCASSGKPHRYGGQNVEYQEAVPPGIEKYPRCYYRDGYAYLVADRWFFRSEIGWLVFVDEPKPLQECRVTRMGLRVPRVAAHPTRHAPP